MMIFSLYKKKNFAQGFTLVELIVAVGLFITAVVIIVGLFIRAVKTQRMVQSIMVAQSNASLSLEQMMREMRTGFSFVTVPGAECGENGQGLGFESLSFTRVQDDIRKTVIYRWNETDKTIERRENMGTFAPLTSEDVEVKRACFFVNQIPDVTSPWRITLLTQIAPRDPHVSDRVINLQTTVSARTIPKEVIMP